MSYPETRQEYRESLIKGIYQLMQAIEADDDSVQPVWIAQRLHHDARTYFDRDRWKPQPVFEGIKQRLPLEEILTFRIQHWAPEPGDPRPGFDWVTGKIVDILSPYRPDDGARLEIVPAGKRKSRSYTYRVGRQTSLKVWRGKLTPEQARSRPPFYEHEAL